jgi:hypothetical protein
MPSAYFLFSSAINISPHQKSYNPTDRLAQLTMATMMRSTRALVPVSLLLLILLFRETIAFVCPFSNRISSYSSQKSIFASFRAATALAVWTQSDLEDYAASQGVVLSLTTLGPGYRAIARSTQNETQILGYVEGFIRPTGKLLHLDKMEVFRKMVKRVRQENPAFKGGGTTLGVGLLLGYLCLLHGKEQGSCEKAEFLAIDDEDFQHKRLVRYYKQSGFDVVKYVGEGFQDVPDRLIWGGCGTLLRKDIDTLLNFWTGLMEKSKEKAEAAR